MSDRPVFGEDEEPRDFDAQREAQRAEWRARKRRQVERSRNAPIAWTGDDDPGPRRLRHGLIQPRRWVRDAADPDRS